MHAYPCVSHNVCVSMRAQRCVRTHAQALLRSLAVLHRMNYNTTTATQLQHNYNTIYHNTTSHLPSFSTPSPLFSLFALIFPADVWPPPNKWKQVVTWMYTTKHKRFSWVWGFQVSNNHHLSSKSPYNNHSP